MRTLAFSVLAAAALAATIARGGEQTPSTQGIAVIVSNTSPVRNVTKDVLREIYLRRQRLWPDGTRVVPINLPAVNPVREEFSKLILGRSTRDMVAYWNGRYFEGITPPQALPSAAAIRRFLTAEPGAIAYLPVVDVDETCRTLILLDPDVGRRGVPGGTAND